MSMRSVVEFNHDYIAELRDRGHISDELFNWLCNDYARRESVLSIGGLRYLALRHHSEAVELTVS